MQRLSSWLIALLALAVFVAAGYVVTKNDPVPDAGQVLPVPGLSASGTAGASAPASDAPTGSGAPSSGASTGRVIAFLGDDWTAGVGAGTKADRFTSRLADSLGVTEKNFGADGTGYAKSSGTDGAYDSRVAALVAADPDIVVVAGGRNDTSDYVPTLQNRIKALFAELRDKLPNATIVAVAPMWGDSDAPAELTPVADAVQRYVTASGGTYLDVADPVHGHPDYMDSAADPNSRGYRAIATALLPKIRALLA